MIMRSEQHDIEEEPALQFDAETVIADYRLAFRSRQVSLIGRREVLSGKANFGIFGDGKEVAQLAMAKVFQNGDFRSGYYRDQTLAFALGMMTVTGFFAQLYANSDVEADPASAGRQMNAHFATRSLNPDGSWQNLMARPNTSSDVSPTGSQMPRLVGLGYASKLYRELDELKHLTQFSQHGNEIAFGTIGNASCAEGLFWESVNAIGVLGAPVIITIYDDGYGISVPNEYQVTKSNVGELLQGFQREPGTTQGYDIYTVRGWDYPALVQVYQDAAAIARQHHVPAIIHITEVTQPQGHSTSGSHERYKSKERLAWEVEADCLRRMADWMLDQGIVTAEELAQYEEEDREWVYTQQQQAWHEATDPIRREAREASQLIQTLADQSKKAAELQKLVKQLRETPYAPARKDNMSAVHHALLLTRQEDSAARRALLNWYQAQLKINRERFSSHLFTNSAKSPLHVPEVKAVYAPDAPRVPGFSILNACFDAMLERDPRVVAFGEDLGYLGDVNQGFAGLQAKYGTVRITDTGIREATIVGQAIGLALRGLRPIAEVQYLDYLLYALQILSDDLATLSYRTAGGQKAPVIIRTRGHRLVGIWHSGSPMGMVIHSLRGIHVVVPRNMVQAAGFYNTLLQGDEPGLVVEVLNGYRLKEKMPENMGEFTVPLGVPEMLREGTDVTVVTYGASCQIALDAAASLSEVGIEVEIIDVQSLLPFDIHHSIVQSLKKTNRILFLDEDVPGGASAYMMQEVLEKQGGYYHLDSEPRTLTAQAHRPAYGLDGNYFSKPNSEDVFRAIYDLMHEADPAQYPIFY